MNIKTILFSIYSITCVGFTFLLGKVNLQIIILSIIMLIDYILGIILAGIFHKVQNLKQADLKVRQGLKELFEKPYILL